MTVIVPATFRDYPFPGTDVFASDGDNCNSTSGAASNDARAWQDFTRLGRQNEAVQHVLGITALDEDLRKRRLLEYADRLTYRAML
jgi:hypothetical protein